MTGACRVITIGSLDPIKRLQISQNIKLRALDLISQIHWRYFSDHTNQRLIAYLVVVQARRDAGILSYDAQILQDLYKVEITDQTSFQRTLTEIGLECRRDPDFQGIDLCIRQYNDEGVEISPQRKPKMRLDKFIADQSISKNIPSLKNNQQIITDTTTSNKLYQSQQHDTILNNYKQSINSSRLHSTDEKAKNKLRIEEPKNQNENGENGDIMVRRTYRISQDHVEIDLSTNTNLNTDREKNKNMPNILKIAKSEPTLQPILKKITGLSKFENEKVIEMPQKLNTEPSQLIDLDLEPDLKILNTENDNFLKGLESQSNYFRSKEFNSQSQKASPRDFNSSEYGNLPKISLKHNSSYNTLFKNSEPYIQS